MFVFAICNILTPIFTPKRKSSESCSDTAGKSTDVPGKLTPFLLPNMPPFSTIHRRYCSATANIKMQPFTARVDKITTTCNAVMSSNENIEKQSHACKKKFLSQIYN